MPARLRVLALGVCLVLLAGFAYGPLSEAGFVGEDYRLFEGAHGGPQVAEGVSRLDSGSEPKPLWRMHGHDFYDVQGIGGAILPGVSISASLRMWGTHDSGRWPAALGYRIENLALLLLGAVLVGGFLRRLLLPWTGSEHARAAAWTSGLLLFFHPLSYAAAAGVGGRAPILYLVLGAACAAFFLRARQDREPLALGLATLAALFASLASEAALGLPVLLASAEFGAAHRYRPMRARLRTSLTTFVLCGAAVQVGPLVRAAYLNEPALPVLRRLIAELGAPGGLWNALAGGVEKLGALCLPVNAHVGGLLGIGAAGALFLVALQPALLAARTAPRLWGWLLVGWVAALLVAGLPSANERVHLSDLTHARALLAPCAIMAVGLGVAATARSGAWRLALPALLVTGYGVLCRVNATPWTAAADAVAELREDVARARELEGGDHRVVVLDPPVSVAGVPAVGDSLGWVLGRPPTRSDDLPEVIGLSLPAFLAFLREREFAELRARPSLVIPPHTPGVELDAAHYVRLEPGEPSQGPRGWSGDGRSPNLDWDPTRAAGVLVMAPAGTPTDTAPELSWRARESAHRFGVHPGVWLPGSKPPVAFFELSAAMDWVLGGRVRRVWFEELPTVERVELVDQPPRFASVVEPDPEGDDWFFAMPAFPEQLAGHSVPLAELGADERAEWVVELLDLGSLEHHELPVVAGPSGTLRVPGAAELVAGCVRAGRGPVAWTLRCRYDGVTLARAGGRRVGVSGSREEKLPPPRH